MSARQLVLWGVPPRLPADGVTRQRISKRLKLTGGTITQCRTEAAERARQGWTELVAAPFRSHPDDVAQCGACGRAWDCERHPTPAMLCPFCNGDARAAARFRCYVLGGAS